MNASAKQQSSAARLALELKKKHGISQAEIQSHHVDTLYQKMKRIPSAADSSNLASLLSFNPARHAVQSKPVYGIIIETRNHFALETVVLNVTHTCNIPVQLFHGPDNLEFIMSTKIAQLVDAGEVVLTKLNINNLSAKLYNTLLLSKEFWEAMCGRDKILVFQTDSLCCSQSDYTLSHFLDFDYIGGGWNRHRITELIIDGGNGGLSLRDWSKSVECLNRFPAFKWGGGEDGYFAFHLDLMGAKVAPSDDSAKFATQNSFQYNSFGAHQIRNLSSEQQKDFFSYCPESKQVFPYLYQQHLS